MPPEDPEQLEIEFPDEDYVSESDYFVVEDEDYEYGTTFYLDPVDIDWDYGDDTEDEEFLSER